MTWCKTIGGSGDLEPTKEYKLLFEREVSWSHMENSMEIPQKIKNRATIWSNNSTPGNLSEENENAN